jgi:hypothetical protein
MVPEGVLKAATPSGPEAVAVAGTVLVSMLVDVSRVPRSAADAIPAPIRRPAAAATAGRAIPPR